MACRIKKLIERSIDTLDAGVDVQKAAALMARRNLGSVVVTSNRQVVGLFTESDLVKRVIAPGKPPGKVAVGEVCSRRLISVSDETSCKNAIKTMQLNGCRRLMVYKGDTLQGMVTLPQVAQALAHQSGSGNLLLNVVGGTTLLVTLSVIGVWLYQLPDMARIAMAMMN